MHFELLILIGSGCMNQSDIVKDAEVLIGKDSPDSQFRLSARTLEHGFGRIMYVPEDHKEFDTAIIVACDQVTVMDWDVLVTCPAKKNLLKNDLVYLEFYGKTIQAKEKYNIGQVAFRYSSLVFSVQMDTVWRKYSTWAKIDKDTPSSDLWIHCSFEPQTIALGGIRLYRYKAGTNPVIFNKSTPSYAPGKAWESQADRRIDSLRKGAASFILSDENGIPLRNCDYKISMTNHQFRFGVAITPHLIIDTTENSEKYRSILKSDFNHAVFEDHLKWRTWNNKEEREIAIKTLKWLKKNNFEVRGHTLVWPWYDFPWNLIALNYDTLALKKAINNHIEEKLTVMKGELTDWDVLNEPFVIRDKPAEDPTGVWLYRNVIDVVCEKEVLNWYYTANKIDPQARLFINDFDMVSDGACFEHHMNDLEELITFLLNNGVQLGGIGFQGHFEVMLTRPEKVYEILNRFSKFNLPIVITEFDTEISGGHDEELYQFTHDFLKICFSHPNVDGFLNWGFWAGKHWKPGTAFYDVDWNLRANGKAWKDLIYKEWWTQSEGRTDSAGNITLSGFYGDYELEYSHKGVNYRREFRLAKEGVSWKQSEQTE